MMKMTRKIEGTRQRGEIVWDSRRWSPLAPRGLMEWTPQAVGGALMLAPTPPPRVLGGIRAPSLPGHRVTESGPLCSQAPFPHHW